MESQRLIDFFTTCINYGKSFILKMWEFFSTNVEVSKASNSFKFIIQLMLAIALGNLVIKIVKSLMKGV